MFEYFTSRPLHMSVWRNSLFYAVLGIVINDAINHFFVTDTNPEGLTGFPGYAVLFLTFGAMTWLARQENGWANEIRYQQQLDDLRRR